MTLYQVDGSDCDHGLALTYMDDRGRCLECKALLEWVVPVEPECVEVWWCKTHEIGQTYAYGTWWDEWIPYTCAIKAEYPVDGGCVPVKVALIGGDE